LQRNQARANPEPAEKEKKISAGAADFIIAGEQAEFAHSTQAKEHKLCKAADRAGESYAFAAGDIRVNSKAGRAGKSRQADADLQERKFKNSDPIPTRPQSMKFATIKADMQRSKFKNRDPIPTRPLKLSLSLLLCSN